MKFFDYGMVVLFVYAFWYSYNYRPLGQVNWLRETVSDYATFFVVAFIWIFLFIPPQAAFYNHFGGGNVWFVLSFFYIAVPFVIGIELWETKPRWVWYLYFVAFYFWLTIFRVDTY